MRIVGLIFIGIGILLCLTFFFAPSGFGAIIAGALLYLAGVKGQAQIGVVTPGISRRAAWTIVVAIVVLVLAGLAIPGKSPPPLTPTAPQQGTHQPGPPAKHHNAKRHTAAP